MSDHQIRTTAPYLSDAEIEGRANKLLRQYEIQFSEIVAPPVPVEAIADLLLELNFDWDEIDDDTVLAFLRPATKTITMNASKRDFFGQYFGTEQFTMAHEIGHWELHVTDGGFTQQLLLNGVNQVSSQEFICRNNVRDRKEIQADIFASYLLMPTKLLLPAVQNAKISWPFLYDLCSQYHVSITALRKRLEKSGALYVTDDGKVYSSKAEANGQMKLF